MDDPIKNIYISRGLLAKMRHRQICFASSHNQKKDNNQFFKKNNQNFQKIKLYKSPTTKELKMKHSSRPVGEVEMGSWGTEDMQQGSSWRTRWARWWLVHQWSHFHVQINGEEQLGSETDHATQGSSTGKIKPQNHGL